MKLFMALKFFGKYSIHLYTDIAIKICRKAATSKNNISKTIKIISKIMRQKIEEVQ